MIGMDFKAAKAQFFDRDAVLRRLDAAKRKVLAKMGAFVRTRARSSIRKRKGTSAPGGPPYSHVGTLKRFIFFAYDRDRESVVIGPALTAPPIGGETAPELLEYGGSVAGGGREIFVANDVGRDARGRFTSGGKRKVKLTGRVRYSARPFMGPALAAEAPGFPDLWRDSVL